jgi:hypothetical protein
MGLSQHLRQWAAAGLRTYHCARKVPWCKVRDGCGFTLLSLGLALTDWNLPSPPRFTGPVNAADLSVVIMASSHLYKEHLM